jgi:hypothetical protein
MVGSDPDKFADLADETGLPTERQETCVGDYSDASWSWDVALKPHRSPGNIEKIDGRHGGDEGGG